MYAGKDKITKVLIYRTGAIGDAIVSIPAINLIRSLFPRATFTLMSAKNRDNRICADAVFAEFEWFDQIVSYWFSDRKRYKNFISLVKAIRSVRADIVIYLGSDKNCALKILRDRLYFLLFAGIKRFIPVYSPKVTFWGYLRRSDKLYTNEALRLAQGIQKKCKIKETKISFDLPIKEEHVQKISDLISESKIDLDRIMIAMCPWSKQPSKRWPLSRYAALGENLIKEFDINVAIVGGKDEVGVGEEISKTWPQGKWTIFAGKLSILETAELLKRCAFYVGNDTGAMHLAAAVKTPCVAVFSARDPAESWHPYGNGHIVIRKSVSCRNCYLTECNEQGLRCLTRISLDDVFQTIKNHISELFEIKHPALGSGKNHSLDL